MSAVAANASITADVSAGFARTNGPLPMKKEYCWPISVLVVRVRTPGRMLNSEAYGSQMLQASIAPRSNAAPASAGPR